MKAICVHVFVEIALVELVEPLFASPSHIRSFSFAALVNLNAQSPLFSVEVLLDIIPSLFAMFVG